MVTGCPLPTPADNLPILAGIQPRNGTTLSLARRAMEPGHLLHSVLACPSSANARHLKWKTHLYHPSGQRLTSLSDNNSNICAAQWVDHQWNAEWLDNPTRRRIFIRDTGIPPEWPSEEQSGSGLTVSALVSDVSTPACTNGVWPPVGVVQKSKPSTMLSSNVQSTNLPMDCMAWRFWTMKQPNGFSTSPPRSCVAKKWFEQLAQKKKSQRTWDN